VNILTGDASTELFGGEVPALVKPLLEQARTAESPEHVLALLLTAQISAPDSPSVYYLLYKFYARQADFAQAELVALKGLGVAAQQAHLPGDWRTVTSDMADFTAPGPARFWLFTLKALAFIRLRQNDAKSAKDYLDKLSQLDPEGGTGAGVIEALMSGSST
jgi:hypothetical protein